MKTSSYSQQYREKQIAIHLQKQIYYDMDGNLTLPRHTRYYFDYLSSQYGSLKMDEKLRDLGFLVSKSFNLMNSVIEYKKDRGANITDSISDTFISYILYMRHGKHFHFTSEFLKNLSESEIIKLFINEIKLRYFDSDHKVLFSNWKDEIIIETANDDSENFIRLVTTTELIKKALGKQL